MSTQQNSPQDDQSESNVSTIKQTTDPDATVLRYASDYERARVTESDQEVERELLFQQLEAYRRFLNHEDEVRARKQAWTSLQRLIHDASIYAESYKDRLSRGEIVDTLIKDMNEEGRHLPYGVAEWIVHEVAESNQTDSDSSGT